MDHRDESLRDRELVTRCDPAASKQLADEVRRLADKVRQLADEARQLADEMRRPIKRDARLGRL